MPVSKRDVAKAIGVFMDNEDLKVTISESGKAAIISGVGAFLGGLFGGPRGVLVGAALGGMTAMAAAEEFKPIGQIMHELTDEQIEQLKNAVEKVVGNLKFLDYAALWRAMNSVSAKQILLQTLMNAFRGFGYQVLEK